MMGDWFECRVLIRAVKVTRLWEEGRKSIAGGGEGFGMDMRGKSVTFILHYRLQSPTAALISYTSTPIDRLEQKVCNLLRCP